jgi:hypothetical protein
MTEISQGAGIQLDVPLRGTNEGYLQTMLYHSVRLGNVVQDLREITDPRPYLMILLYISMVTDDVKRKELNESLRKLIEERASDPEMDSKVRAERRLECCFIILGEIWSWVDQSLALSTKNVVVGA